MRVDLALKIGLSTAMKRVGGRSLDPIDRTESSFLSNMPLVEDHEEFCEDVRRSVGLREFQTESKEQKVKKNTINWGKGKALRDTIILERRERENQGTNY